MLKNILRKIQSVFVENRIIFMWILLFFLIGIVLGSYTVYYMSDIGKVELGGYFSNFLTFIKTANVDYAGILLQSIKGSIPIVLVIIVLGYTLIGFPFVLLINLFKGYILGFTFSLVITVLGTGGIGVVFSTLIVQNIIFVPVIMIISILSMKSSIIKLKSITKDNSRKELDAREYLIIQGILTCIIIVGIIVETYISPNLAKIVIS